MTSPEIVQALRSKEIVPFDEIAIPFGRWHYIRDEAVFDKVVNEIKNKKQTGEATITNTGTDTYTDTATDITERISAFGSEERLTAGITEQLKEGVKVTDSLETSPVETVVYGYKRDQTFHQPKPNKNYWIMAALIVVLGGLSWKVINTKGGFQSKRTYESSLTEAKKQQSLGNYSESMSAYKEALELESKGTEAAMGYAGLLLSQRLTAEARRYLDVVVAFSPKNEERAQAFVGLALAAIQNFDYQTAKKYLAEASSIQNNDSYLILVNRAAISLLESRPADAEKDLLAALDKGVPDPLAGIMLAETSLLLAKEGQGFQALLKGKSVLEAVVTNGLDYNQEALAYLMHILIELKREAELEDVATQFLNLDPELTENHLKTTLLHRESAEWSHIAKYLRTSFGTINLTPRISAALGLVLYKGRDKLEGKRVIEDAQSKAPNDKLIRSVLSYVQFDVGREEEAQAGLTVSLVDSTDILPLVLKARWCRAKKDYLCAEETWKKLLDTGKLNVVAMSGLAQTYYEKGAKELALDMTLKGLARSPTYIPLLNIQSKLRGKGT